MKRIFLSVILAAVGICAWCENVTVTFKAQSGSQSDDCVSVGVPNNDLYWSQYNCWRLPEHKNTDYKFLEVKVKDDAFNQGYRISKVAFTLATLDISGYFNTYLVPDIILLTCNNASQATTWVKNDYYKQTCTYNPTPNADPKSLLFCATISDYVNVTEVTVTYHKHSADGAEHHAAVPSTCGTKGTIEYWECDCGKKFSDSNLTTEVTSIEGELAPDNHSSLTEVEGIASTCTSTGILHHWHCDGCGKDFKDEEATVDITGSISTPRKEPDAVTVQQLADDDFSYLLEGEGVELTIDGDNVNMTVNGKDEKDFTLSETDAITICPAHTFKLKANQDPDHKTNYYSTFYTSEGAYKVPEDGSAKAYAGTVESGEKTDVLKLADIGGIIHAEEPVILRAIQSDIVLMPSCNMADASTPNILEGTDGGKILDANQYAMALGQYGVGFYLWEGKSIGAHKAYLTLPSSFGAKAFIFQFEDDPTGIESLTPALSEGEGAMYNLNGIRVNNGYKGIVIKNGKKVYQK